MRSGLGVRALVLATAGLLAASACAKGKDSGPLPSGTASSSASASASATGGSTATPSGSASATPAAARAANLPLPAVALSETVTSFAAALRSGDCARTGTFVTTRQRIPGVEPGSEPGDAECTQLEKFLSPLASFAPTANQEFGTAAVVDGTLNGAVATTLWILDADRRWRIDPTAYVYPTADDPDVHSVGTAPRPGNKFAANARAWVDAWRANDCVDVFRLTDPFSAFVTDNGGTEDELCQVVDASFTGDGIGRMLAANPDVELQELGAVDQYGFSLLRAADGSLFTIVSIVQATNATQEERSAHDNYAVYNIYRSRPATVTAAPTSRPTGRSTGQASARPQTLS